MKIPPINDLRVFAEAARLGSLSAAARELGRSPAAASASLKRLEAELGLRLFERNTRNLRLTPEGLQYRERLMPALSLLDEAHQPLAAGTEVAGEIRLTAPVDLSRQCLRPLLDAFQVRHPEVRLTLLLGDDVRDVVSEPIDLAVRYGDLPDSSLVAQRLMDNRRTAVGAPGYFARHGRLETPEDLKHHNCLVYLNRNVPYRHWLFRRRGRTVRVEVQGDRISNDGSVVRDWVLDGVGIAYKSELDVRADLAAGRLEPVFTDWLGTSAPLNVVFPGTGPRPPRVRALVQFLRESLRG